MMLSLCRRCVGGVEHGLFELHLAELGLIAADHNLEYDNVFGFVCRSDGDKLHAGSGAESVSVDGLRRHQVKGAQQAHAEGDDAYPEGQRRSQCA